MERLPFNLAGIPDELKARRQWLGYRTEWSASSQKFLKVPVHKWADDWHWRTLADVLSAKQLPGFVYGRGVVGLDLDKCVIEGQLSSQAADYVRKLKSYTEYSLSGTGVHILMLGDPLPTRQRRKELWSEGHWIALTGQRVPGTNPNVENRNVELTHLEWELRSDRSRETSPGAPYEPPDEIRQGEGGGRIPQLFRLLRHWQSLEFTFEEAHGMMQRFNQRHVKPPIPEAELEDWFPRAWHTRDRAGFNAPVVDPSEVAYE